MAGFALAVAAQRAMGAAWRIGVEPAEDPTLVISGPLARMRNPVFIGMLLHAFGVASLAPA